MKRAYDSAREFYFSANTGTMALEKHIDARDAEWAAKVEGLEAEVKAQAESDVRNHRAEVGVLRAEVEAARARLAQAERLLRQWDDGGNCHGATDVFLRGAPPPADSPVPARACGCGERMVCDVCQGVDKTKPTLDAPVPSNSFLAPAWARLDALNLDYAILKRRIRYMEEALGRHDYGGRIDALSAKVTALEAASFCVHGGRRDSAGHEACVRPFVPPVVEYVPVAEPVCIDCGQSDATNGQHDWHHPFNASKPEAAGPVHAWREPHRFVEGAWPNRSECSAPTKSPNNESCGLYPGDPIHATERK